MSVRQCWAAGLLSARVRGGAAALRDLADSGGTGSGGPVVRPAWCLCSSFERAIVRALSGIDAALQAVEGVDAASLSWRDAYPVIETSAAVIVNATDLAADHGLTIWDSVVLAASAEAGCRLLLS